jgi:hypothetical protein
MLIKIYPNKKKIEKILEKKREYRFKKKKLRE